MSNVLPRYNAQSLLILEATKLVPSNLSSVRTLFMLKCMPTNANYIYEMRMMMEGVENIVLLLYLPKWWKNHLFIAKKATSRVTM